MLVKDKHKTAIVYRRNGQVKMVALDLYLSANMDSNGAKRIAVIGGSSR